jgi:SAM-dependent methyltransferase
MHRDNKWIDKDGHIHYGQKVISKDCFDVIECEKCNFKHVIPIPTENELEEIYKQDYYLTEKPFYIERYLEDKDWWELIYNDRFETFEQILPEGRRKILDIGSGPGLFLNLGRKRGWQTKGIEPSSQAAKYSKETLKLDIEEVFFDKDSSKTLGKYDVINMGEVLEHLPNPKEIIDLSYTSLNDDGLLCLIVPNDFNPFQMILTDSMNFDPWWVAPPHHINYFDFDSLETLVTKSGFKVIHKEPTFPIDMFLLMGENYISDDKLGRECHKKRKIFEMNLYKDKDLLKKLRKGFLDMKIGREIVLYAQKVKF